MCIYLERFCRAAVSTWVRRCWEKIEGGFCPVREGRPKQDLFTSC